MSRRFAIGLLSAFFAVTGASDALTPAPTVRLREITASLRLSGGPATLQRYFSCENGPGYAIVASGDAAAVKLGVDLVPFTDACTGELMGDALGTAMRNNPEVVLPYLDSAPFFRDYRICLPLMLETPPAEANLILDRQERALVSVRDPVLLKKRDECLDVIRSARRNINGDAPPRQMP